MSMMPIEELIAFINANKGQGIPTSIGGVVQDTPNVAINPPVAQTPLAGGLARASSATPVTLPQIGTRSNGQFIPAAQAAGVVPDQMIYRPNQAANALTNQVINPDGQMNQSISPETYNQLASLYNNTKLNQGTPQLVANNYISSMLGGGNVLPTQMTGDHNYAQIQSSLSQGLNTYNASTTGKAAPLSLAQWYQKYVIPAGGLATVSTDWTQPYTLPTLNYAKGGLSNLVAGEGDGRQDKIPARLSDGEYIMDAETVALLGNGSTKAGAAKLDQFRRNLRAQKGKALSNGKISPDAKSVESYIGDK